MRTRNWAAALMTAVLLLIGCLSYAQDHECKVVGWEVFTNSTPGGGGQPTSQGLTGERTPWSITTPVGGTGADTFAVRYYCCKECRDAAIKKDKEDKAEAEEKKKNPPKKNPGKPPKGGKPPVGPDVPTFDPRFYELDENGRVVPKKPKEEDAKKFEHEHQNCEKPVMFECGEHFQWWLKNHDHRTEMPKVDGKPRLILSGVVIAGQEATATAVDAKGVVLSGVVIELPDGKTVQTDKNGVAKYLVPLGFSTLILKLADSGSGGKQFVMNHKDAIDSRPEDWRPVRFEPQPVFSSQNHVLPFDGRHSGYQLFFDGRPLVPVASSIMQATVTIPHGTAPGLHTLAAMADGHVIAAQTLQVCQLVAEPPKTFVLGQSGSYKISVLGSSEPVRVMLENLSPDVVQISPGKGLDLMSGSVWRAQATIRKSMSLNVRALKAGAIKIVATPIEPWDRWNWAG